MFTYYVDRNDKRFIAKHGKQKAFFKGSNTSMRHHLRSHWEEYQKGCLEAGIPLHHYAVPRHIWKKISEKRKKKGKEQLTLDDVVVKEAFPKEFSHEAILCAVTQFVVCDDQVRS